MSGGSYYFGDVQRISSRGYEDLAPMHIYAFAVSCRECSRPELGVDLTILPKELARIQRTLSAYEVARGLHNAHPLRPVDPTNLADLLYVLDRWQAGDDGVEDALVAFRLWQARADEARVKGRLPFQHMRTE